MSNYQKYLSYKKKYLDLKEKLIGGREINNYVHPRYKAFSKMKNNIKYYLNNYNPYYHLGDLIKEVYSFSKCKNTCWINFIKDAVFTEYINSINLSNFFIFPILSEENDNNYSTQLYLRPTNNIISYELNKKFLAITFTDVIMFDFDIKDEIKSEVITPEEYKKNLLSVINKVKNISQVFYKKYGIVIKFLFLTTDRGYHFFLLNRTGYYRNLFLIHLMMAVCNDNWYSAFSYNNGWAIRLLKKKKTDYTAEIAFSDDFKNCLKNNNNIPDSKFNIQKLNGKINFMSKIFNKNVEIRYPENIFNESLIIIEPDTSVQVDYIDENIQSILNYYMPDIDQTDYIFNKICYHYCLIKFFNNFDDSYIDKLECNISEIVTGTKNNSIIQNIRDDIETFASHFNIDGESIINNFGFR
jgi:hypothetical protein